MVSLSLLTSFPCSSSSSLEEDDGESSLGWSGLFDAVVEEAPPLLALLPAPLEVRSDESLSYCCWDVVLGLPCSIG